MNQTKGNQTMRTSAILALLLLPFWAMAGSITTGSHIDADTAVYATTAGTATNAPGYVPTNRTITVQSTVYSLDGNISITITETDTLQSVVSRGGTVTSGAVTIDAANARTNTFGGQLVIGWNRYQANNGVATGDGSWANNDGIANAFGAWANNGGVARGDRSFANNFGIADGDGSWASGQGATALEDGSFVWGNIYSHGDNTFNIGTPDLLFLGHTNLATYLAPITINTAAIAAQPWRTDTVSNVIGTLPMGVLTKTGTNLVGAVLITDGAGSRSWTNAPAIDLGNSTGTLPAGVLGTSSDRTVHSMTASGVMTAGVFQASAYVTGTVVNANASTAGKFYFTTATNVTLSVTMTAGQQIPSYRIRNTATNSITATANDANWKWTGGGMTNTIPSGLMMYFGWDCAPDTGATNAFATAASVN